MISKQLTQLIQKINTNIIIWVVINRWKVHMISWYYRMQMVLLLFLNFSKTNQTLNKLNCSYHMHVRIILCYTADWTRDVLHVMQPGWSLDTDTRSPIYQLMNIWIIQWMNQWWISYYHMICNFQRILCLKIYGNMFCKKYSLSIFFRELLSES